LEEFTKKLDKLYWRLIQIFIRTPKEDKNLTFLLKGLNQSFGIQEILDELKKQALQNILFNNRDLQPEDQCKRIESYLYFWYKYQQTVIQHNYEK